MKFMAIYMDNIEIMGTKLKFDWDEKHREDVKARLTKVQHVVVEGGK
jgi:hypothetical protein